MNDEHLERNKVKLRKTALKRRLNLLELRRNNRLIDFQENELNKRKISIRAANDVSSYVSSKSTDKSKQLDNGFNENGDHNYALNNTHNNTKFDENEIDLHTSGKSENSNSCISNNNDEVTIAPNIYKQETNLFFTSSENIDFTNESFANLNNNYKDICAFSKLIQLKIQQINSKRSTINSFDDIDPIIHTLFRFLKKCQINFKHFSRHLVKNYKELYENFNKSIGDKILLESDDSLEQSLEKSNKSSSETSHKSNDEEQEQNTNPLLENQQTGATFSDADKSKIMSLTPIVAIEKFDDHPLNLPNYDGLVRELNVSIEKCDDKFPELFQSPEKCQVSADENRDNDEDNAKTDETNTEKLEKDALDTEISRLTNLNNLKRSHDSDSNNDQVKKLKTCEKSQESVHDEGHSTMDESDQSNHSIEVEEKSAFSEEHINDLAVDEILNLADSNSGDEPVTSTSTIEQKKVNKAGDFMIDEEKLKADMKNESTTEEETKEGNVFEHDKKICRRKFVPNLHMELSTSSNLEDSSECELINSSQKIYVSVSSSDNEDVADKGRKNIREIIDSKYLEMDTQRANKEERKRLERITLKDQTRGLNTNNTEQFILDRHPETKEVIVAVHPLLNKHLKNHQRDGIKFMWDSCYETVDLIKDKKSFGNGCILAHCMGLGKSLQVIAFAHTLMRHKSCQTRTVLIICPKSVTLNWKDEIQKWLSPFPDKEKKTFDLTNISSPNMRCLKLSKWQSEGGFMIINYDMYRNMMNLISDPSAQDTYKNHIKCFKESLRNPGPDIVFLDEGHVLKNEKTKLRIQLEEIRTRRRVILTGTPMQNNLREYYWMVHFVKPNLLGSFKEFTNRFANPIRNGQHKNSNFHDINLMKTRSHVLHKLLKGTVQRKEVGILKKYLPKKFEYVLYLKPSEIQEKLYNNFLISFGQKAERSSVLEAAKFFADFQALKRIWTHPYALVDFLEKTILLEQKQKFEMLMDVDEIIDDDDSEKIHKVMKKMKKPLIPADWWKKFYTLDVLNSISASSKLLIVFNIIEACKVTGEKVLIFSSSLNVLNTIEHFLKIISDVTSASGNQSEEHPAIGKFRGIWETGKDYFRFDGNLPLDDRLKYCNVFNDPENKRARLFLVSTRAGGIGLNMIGANRVIILDVSWNPAVDTQSIFRTYRYAFLITYT